MLSRDSTSKTLPSGSRIEDGISLPIVERLLGAKEKGTLELIPNSSTESHAGREIEEEQLDI